MMVATAKKKKNKIYAEVSGNPMFGSVDVFLNQKQGAQEIIADSGTMLWMDKNISVKASMHGGCWSSCMRTCSGEHCCLNTYSISQENMGGLSTEATVALANVLPGSVTSFVVTRDIGWILSKGAFLCGTTNLKISARFTGCCTAVYSGEGGFLTKITLEEGETTNGSFFAGGYGGLNRHILGNGDSLMIDNGMFFAGPDELKIKMAWIGGVKTSCFSGEGVVMVVDGPCIVYTQNRDPSVFKSEEAVEE